MYRHEEPGDVECESEEESDDEKIEKSDYNIEKIKPVLEKFKHAVVKVHARNKKCACAFLTCARACVHGFLGIFLWWSITIL